MLNLKNFLEPGYPDVIYFDNDDAFYDFCVIPQLIILTRKDKDGNEYKYTDFDFSKQYLDALKNDMKFVIKDQNSEIAKRGEVSYRTITKPVQNLQNYYPMIDDEYGN